MVLSLPPRHRHRLVVDRGFRVRRYGWQWRNAATGTYEQHLATRRRMLRKMTTVTRSDRKRPAIAAAYVRVGESFRAVDGNGRAFGPRYRLSALAAWNTWAVAHDADGQAIDLCPRLRVRLVSRQPEDLHSRMSRMLKASHRHGLAD